MTETAGSGPDLPEDSRALLDAVVAISSDLDLHSMLERRCADFCSSGMPTDGMAADPRSDMCPLQVGNRAYSGPGACGAGAGMPKRMLQRSQSVLGRFMFESGSGAW